MKVKIISKFIILILVLLSIFPSESKSNETHLYEKATTTTYITTESREVSTGVYEHRTCTRYHFGCEGDGDMGCVSLNTAPTCTSWAKP